MLPSLGFQEILLLGVLALVVVGPKDLPLLLRKLGRWTAKLRGMAQEFRSGFDELARQAELDELKKEVDALRRNQVFSDINREISKPMPSMDPITSAPPVAALPAPEPTTEATIPPLPAEAEAADAAVHREVVDESPGSAAWPEPAPRAPEPVAANEDDALVARRAP